MKILWQRNWFSVIGKANPNPDSEIRKKSEFRNPNWGMLTWLGLPIINLVNAFNQFKRLITLTVFSGFGFRNSFGFRISDFGFRSSALCLLTLLLLSTSAFAQRAGTYLNKSATWFATEEAKKITTNILSHQSDLGGWPKNTDTASKLFTGDRASLKPTFDNSATTDELRFLARMMRAGAEAKYRDAFERGYDYILKAQYPTGGWPQFYPPSTQYHRHITFNDNAMVRLLEFLRETWQDARYGFLDDARKKAAREAFDRGIECILKCQIKVNGKLTAWCAQHDELDYQPRIGRAYELATISGSESVAITRLLMSLDQPSPEVAQAVEAAVAWFQSAALKGIKVVEEKDEQSPKGKNKVVKSDPSAPPLWARFYDLKTNRPIFCDRDGIPKASLAEIGYERRNGYAWYGNWPQSLLEKDYPAWKKKQAAARQ